VAYLMMRIISVMRRNNKTWVLKFIQLFTIVVTVASVGSSLAAAGIEPSAGGVHPQ
jgi:hypothetical protein